MYVSNIVRTYVGIWLPTEHFRQLFAVTYESRSLQGSSHLSVYISLSFPAVWDCMYIVSLLPNASCAMRYWSSGDWGCFMTNHGNAFHVFRISYWI